MFQSLLKEIFDEKSQYERSILKHEYLILFQDTFKDVEDGVKVVLTNHYWYE